MGAWGTAITSDDTVSDVVGTVVDRMKAGDTLAKASAVALNAFKSSLADSDDGPLVWLALAHVQWKYGEVDPAIFERVRNDIAAERGLSAWRDRASSLKRRKQALDAFLKKIAVPNPKPAAVPRAIVRLASFAAGDCLSLLTQTGQHTAAIVLLEDHSRAEYGKNLIGSLDYLSDSPPTSTDFEARRWLCKYHGNWKGEQELSWYPRVGPRQEGKRVEVVGRTVIRASDPRTSDYYSNWSGIGAQILLCRGQA